MLTQRHIEETRRRTEKNLNLFVYLCEFFVQPCVKA